jgi:FAD dependent oxidoreductase TIGR03364
LNTGARLVVVGGGVLGVMHAWFARRAGFEVVHLERELAPRGASLRNFGLVWVGGRAGGAELALALRARELWASVAACVEGVGLRAAGSLTVAADEAELALMKEACERPDAALRQWELLDALEARRVNPELSERVLGALWCRADAIVEPRFAVQAVREHLLAQGGYSWLPGREAVDLLPRAVRDDCGDCHRGDWVVLCPGAVASGLVRRYCAESAGLQARLRRVRLQMLETTAYAGVVTTAIADGDSMRYYPAFDLPGRALLPPRGDVADTSRAQLLVVQRLDGSLTIGDTHDYSEVFDFDLDERIYDYLLAKAATLLHQRVPSVRRRWAGVYSEMVPGKGEVLYLREELLPGVELVTGAGGRGMTCAPAIAEQSLVRWGAPAGGDDLRQL